jgi:hypothetical protein
LLLLCAGISVVFLFMLPAAMKEISQARVPVLYSAPRFFMVPFLNNYSHIFAHKLPRTSFNKNETKFLTNIPPRFYCAVCHRLLGSYRTFLQCQTGRRTKYDRALLPFHIFNLCCVNLRGFTDTVRAAVDLSTGFPNCRLSQAGITSLCTCISAPAKLHRTEGYERKYYNMEVL